jgi:4-hydroxybenzoate polyprenyltransferase
VLKKVLYSILDFFLFSNLFIAVCAVAQGLITYHLLKVPADKYVLAFIFFATIGLYNFSMLLSKPKKPEDSPYKRVRWIFSHHRMIISITLISILCLVPLFLLYLNIESQLLMVFTGLVAVGYNIPFLTLNNQNIGLRNIPGIKLFLIAMVWAVSCVLLPIMELQHSHQLTITPGDTLLLVIKRFLFVAAITVPFDIRDLFQDRLYALKTIPVMLGEKKAYIFCQFLLLGYLLLLLLFRQATYPDIAAVVLNLALTGWLIFKSNIKKNEYYYFLYLDGTMLLQYILLVSFSWIFAF